jgi:hypothetical protein
MVSLIFSSTNGGASITSPLDHGDSVNGATTTAQEIFLRHDGANNITSVGLYLKAYSGTYTGSATAAGDFAEIIGWADQNTATTFGGVHINWLATSSYPTSAWPVYTSKTPTGGIAFRSGTGDSAGTLITLPITTGAVLAGVIQPGSSPNVRFDMKVQVPDAEDTVGTRLFDLAVQYTYTS